MFISILFYFIAPFGKDIFLKALALKKGIIIFICGIKRIYTYANSLKPELLKNFRSFFFGERGGGGGWVILVVAYVGRKNTDHYEGKKKQSEQVKERSRLRNYC